MAPSKRCPHCGEHLDEITMTETELTFDGTTIKGTMNGACFKCHKRYEWVTYFDAADSYEFKEL